MSGYTAEYPRPDHLLLHFSDTHFLAADVPLYGAVDGEEKLRQLFEQLEASGARPEAIIFTGDLADKGEAGAYAKLRAIVEPAAARLGAQVIWVMGNHDDRATFRGELLRQHPEASPIDQVYDVNGLRVISLDTSVPGHHYGAVDPDQLRWLKAQLATPAPHGTILALHHPPIPSVLDLAVLVELRGQRELAEVVRGTDVRSIIGGHLHYSTTATFAGIPVSVASSSCYTQDLAVPVGGTRGQDGAQAFNLIHVYDETVLHSVVPIGPFTPVSYVTAEKTATILAAAGVVIAPAVNAHVVSAPAPIEPELEELPAHPPTRELTTV